MGLMQHGIDAEVIDAMVFGERCGIDEFRDDRPDAIAAVAGGHVDTRRAVRPRMLKHTNRGSSSKRRDQAHASFIFFY